MTSAGMLCGRMVNFAHFGFLLYYLATVTQNARWHNEYIGAEDKCTDDNTLSRVC